MAGQEGPGRAPPLTLFAAERAMLLCTLEYQVEIRTLVCTIFAELSLACRSIRLESTLPAQRAVSSDRAVCDGQVERSCFSQRLPVVEGCCATSLSPLKY